MKFFIDTANMSEIQEAFEWGILSGVTTNPSLVAKEKNVTFEDRLKEITDLVPGSVSAEVIATDAEGMIKEGRELAKIAPNITVKLPMTPDGLKATSTFAKEGIKTNVTLIFSANQALLAARAGATYVSPFLGRLDDIGEKGTDLVKEIRTIYDNYGLKSKILAARIRNVDHVKEVAMMGADIATMSYKVYQELFKHKLTDKGIKQFLDDWDKLQKELKNK